MAMNTVGCLLCKHEARESKQIFAKWNLRSTLVACDHWESEQKETFAWLHLLKFQEIHITQQFVELELNMYVLGGFSRIACICIE